MTFHQRIGQVAGIAPVSTAVPRGAVSFHHSRTVHCADANTTDRDRAVHTIIYVADGSTRGDPHPHFAVDRAGIEVGQPIVSDVTPIAFPRPPGDLPTPPASWTEHPPLTNPGSVPIRMP